MFTGLESDTKEIWKSATVKRSVDLEFLLYSGINGLFLQNSAFFLFFMTATFAAHQFPEDEQKQKRTPLFCLYTVLC